MKLKHKKHQQSTGGIEALTYGAETKETPAPHWWQSFTSSNEGRTEFGIPPVDLTFKRGQRLVSDP